VNQRPCGGNCVEIFKDPFNCGGCNKACAPGEQCLADAAGNAKCTTYCAPGRTACAQTGGGFICENLSSDRFNCGSCNHPCLQGQVCTSDVPDQPGHCAADCALNLKNCSGSCRDVTSDDAFCGDCVTSCSTGTHCVLGKCTITCTPGQTACTDSAGNRNCVDLTKDRANCGGCGVACAPGQICAGSSCQVSCQSGLTLCGSNCVNTVADANNCGGCGIACGAGQVCTNHGAGGTGFCELQCPIGETSCAAPAWKASTGYFAGNQVVNGANLYQCTSGGTSAASGGPAVTASSITDGTAVWKFVPATTASTTQCISLQSDRNNCGACDDIANSKACGNGQVCMGGACVVSCAPGLTPCNGTCVDTRNDPTNCGACGISCSASGSAGPVCGSGACGVSCPAGEINCSGKCVDPSSDPSHCGTGAAACSVACAAGQVCSNGGCTLSCPAGSVACSGKCIDPLHDNNNCGTGTAACGHPCSPGLFCSNGICAATCVSPPFTTCNPGTASAYCTNTSYDPANCGVCGKKCALQANASVYCGAGNCAATCTGTYAHCTTVATDVCETNLSNNAAHCGTCSNSCPAADNANPACVSSSCSTTCQPGFLDCDLDPSTGCEADAVHDAANCGVCGTVCSGGTPYCVNKCVAAASLAGVQQNLTLSTTPPGSFADWGLPCFSESYSHVGTTLAAIQGACPTLTGQVLVACAAPGAPTLLVAAAGPRATVFTSGGTASGASFYLPGTGVPAFGFTPAGAATTFSTYDVAGTLADGFVAGVGSQRVSWPVQSGVLTGGGRCGDRAGSSATSNYLRLVFTK
jgi:hypothetical protein